MVPEIEREFGSLVQTGGPSQPTEPDPTTQAYSGMPPPPPSDRASTVREVDSLVAAASAPARRFGKYEVLEKIGGGGMGVVYKARDVDLGRFVALKTLRSGIFADQAEIDRFLREARVVAQLRDPHIIAIYDFGMHEGVPFFVMELLQGGSLARQREQLAQASPQRVALLVEKVARALHQAHEQGIIHRDLKPGNILLDEAGEPKLGDFGLAKRLDADADLTQTGMALGTPAYMSPEQIGGLHEALSPQTDVWSLGVMLYELLTRRRPFAGKSREELISNIKTAEPLWPRRERPDLPPDLEAIILKCLEKKPQHRYRSAAELGDDLARWRQGEPTVARPWTTWQRWRRTLRRQQRWLYAAGIGLALVAAAWLFIRNNREPADWQQQEKELLAEWRAEGKITFLTSKGSLKGGRWVLGQQTSNYTSDDKGLLWMTSGDLGLFQLLSKAPAQDWELSMTIKQDVAQYPGGGIGLYAFHSEVPDGNGQTGRTLLRFTINDLSPQQQPGAEPFRWFVQQIFFPSSGDHHGLYRGQGPLATPKEPWRRLKLSYRKDRIGAYVDNALIKEFERKQIEDLSNDRLKDHGVGNAVPPLTLDARGGVGIYVHLFSAFFKDIELRILPNQT